MWKSSVYSVGASICCSSSVQRSAGTFHHMFDVLQGAQQCIRCGLWSVFQLTPLALPFPAALYGDVFVLYGMKAKIRSMTSSWNILLTAVLTREKCL